MDLRQRAMAGVLAGWAGLATAELTAGLLAVRESPVVSVAEWVVRLTPGQVAEAVIQRLGHWDKPFLVASVLLVLSLGYAALGSARQGWVPLAGFTVVAGIGAVAVATRADSDPRALLPLGVGLAVNLVVWNLLAGATAPTATDEERRAFLRKALVVAAGVAVLGVGGRLLSRGRSAVEAARDRLRLPGVTSPRAPEGAQLPGLEPWQTPAHDFYRIDTTLAPPTIKPADWTLRIHGLVDREITVTFEELTQRPLTQAWITLNCVSNPVGGDLVGNAWWSGYRIADLLAEAGVSPEADAVLQTSHDGWTCGTPIEVLTDDRPAMLAVAMNGEPLPVEHGFPVRMIVPGLYGFVSATKWVVDLEVTRFDRFTAYWTDRDWAAQAPVRLASRIDTPRDGARVDAGPVRIGGVAWHQHTGIDGVDVSLDGGDWTPATLATEPTVDSWVQWAVELDVPGGDHRVRVRARDRAGEVQTGERRDVVPDGATGWHEVSFTAR
jgi:DMSO/TMAO reductase YedYZ molybdopterin-dependent catalytic subunit